MKGARRREALGRFGVATTVGLFLVLIMGALVTDTGSAQGCGHSWPLCHGQFIPAFALTTLVEFSHRAVSGVVGIMVAVLAVWAWRAEGRRPLVRLLAAVGAGFVLVQALLGGAAVMHPQSPEVLSLHFGFSLLAFAGVLLLTVVVRQPEPASGWAPAPHRFAVLAWVSLAYVYCLVYLGAYVAHTGSAAGCLDWPLCEGRLIPPLTGATGIQFAHRVAALGAVVLLGWLFAAGRGLRRERPDLYRGSHAALALVLLQALSGALVVLSRVDLFALLVHSTLVSCLFGAQSYICLQLVRGGSEAEERAAARPPVAGRVGLGA